MANSFLCPMPMDYNLLASESQQVIFNVSGFGTYTKAIDCTGFTYFTITCPAVTFPVRCTNVELQNDRMWSVSIAAFWSISADSKLTELSSRKPAEFTKDYGDNQAYVGQVVNAVSDSVRYEGLVPSNLQIEITFHSDTAFTEPNDGGWIFAYAGSVQTIPIIVQLRY